MDLPLEKRIFHLTTDETSYLLFVNDFGHLENVYYGPKITLSEPYDLKEIEDLRRAPTLSTGTNVSYDEEKDPYFTLDWARLEVGTPGKGDFRGPSLLVEGDKGFVNDFRFVSSKNIVRNLDKEDLPYPLKFDESLQITLEDDMTGAIIVLRYLVYKKSNVIARDVVIKKGNYRLHKALSFNLDLPQKEYEVLSTYGAWGSEGHVATHELVPGVFSVKTQAGPSSNRHNPLTIVKTLGDNLENGLMYGFNLVYSGPFEMNFELTPDFRLRINGGINALMFYKDMKDAEGDFVTPWAVMTVTKRGQNGIKANFHQFVNKHIIRGRYQNKARPILINNWEGTYFNFTERKIHQFIKKGQELGFELFVLDDGWFVDRDSDYAGLGNFDVNKKKLPHGIDGLAKYAKKHGLKFGLWIEPEMVNEGSDTYNNYYEYVMQVEGFEPSKCRHQLCLDLRYREIQDYLINKISTLVKSANISYIKWDYNRPLSDFGTGNSDAGTFFYDYTVGLYRILREVMDLCPNVLFEGCASGGNRFDLGVLCYFPQIWASDCSDAIERIRIQSTLSLGYPQSTYSSHVTTSPNHQTLRRTSLTTRFAMAMLGVFGYELDITHLTPLEERQIKEQIAFYKEHRHLLLYGQLQEIKLNPIYNKRCFCVINPAKTESIVVFINEQVDILPHTLLIPSLGLDETRTYKITSNKQYSNIKDFGSLLKFVLPKHIKYDGFIINTLSKTHSAEEMTKNEVKLEQVVPGTLLNSGKVSLYPEWGGRGISDETSILGDFGAVYLHIKAID